MNVAWIGLGHMGLPTAKAVAAAGHTVRAYDIKTPAPEEARGLILTASGREAAAGCDVACLSLFSDDQVEEVLTGPDGIFPVLREGAVVTIFTTGTVDAVKALASVAPEGIAVLDTCFSRQAAAPTEKYKLLVGGNAEALERCRPVLGAFSEDLYHVGDTGSGRALKLVNNLLWVAHIRVARNALDLAEKIGLERTAAARIILECTGASDVMNLFVKPDIAELLEFMHPYMVKDASAAAETARGVGADLGTLGAVVNAYTSA